jgi:hypothetical protein
VVVAVSIAAPVGSVLPVPMDSVCGTVLTVAIT